MKISGDIITLEKREKLILSGEYMVISGCLSCTLSEHLIDLVGPQKTAVFEKYLFDGKLSYEAKATTKLIKILPDTSGSFVVRKRVLEESIWKAIVQQLDAQYLTTETRICILLCLIGESVGIIQDGACYLPTVLTQAEMAMYANCSREYLCTIRKQLIVTGELKKERHWVLLDWKRWRKQYLHYLR
ncbi:Crp/Fnr family transcriptional regulator [Listeria booriae]|uniref:Crp/Fnr family transcriptional regulator n=1 Tax=Listeria booriae TaxID=1552123 RepID=A0A842G2K2_9LIST|nr:Crp/Fnr family transcriptional regulator [Listeria booriae]MBC1284698.1 Crp/Fnr family transcriptional regulator [Listeria booriae]MBC2283001.1 Crp/Fnr family transcriptional regulator [Listeria booriae]MBC2291970.1 Crp/Fnr family transcriptional regulator [Listeria booriae]